MGFIRSAYILPFLDNSSKLSFTHAQVLVDDHAGKDGAEDDNLVDFRGNLVDKSKTGGWLAAGLILGAFPNNIKLCLVC